MQDNKIRIKERLYEKAYDRVTKKMVTPEEVDECDAHDRNRWFSEPFSENEDKGDVLTLNLGAEYINRRGKTVKYRRHFSKIGRNTLEYRKVTDRKVAKQESLVHKLCKDVIQEIDFIKIPSVEATILNNKYTIIHEQFAEVKFKDNERKDTDTGRIPDSQIEITINGIKQTVFIEYIYKHALDESKKKQCRFHKKNCLQVNISKLRDKLDLSEKELKNKITQAIKYECKWVSCSLKELLENDVTDEFFITLDLNSMNIQRSTIRTSDVDDWKFFRLFFFRDTLTHKFNLSEKHPCYTSDTGHTSRSIGECINCDNCAYSKGYNSDKEEDVQILCDRKCIGIKNMNHIEFINKFIDRGYELIINNEQH